LAPGSRHCLTVITLSSLMDYGRLCLLLLLLASPGATETCGQAKTSITDRSLLQASLHRQGFPDSPQREAGPLLEGDDYFLQSGLGLFETNVDPKNQLCKVSICVDRQYGPSNCQGGITKSTRGILKIDLTHGHNGVGPLEDEISSILVSDGCSKVELWDEDGDGDLLVAYPPGKPRFPGDFDNDVKTVKLYAKNASTSQPVPVSEMEECCTILWKDDRYSGEHRTFCTNSFSQGEKFDLQYMRDEISSFNLSSGCKEIQLYDDDSDGETAFFYKNQSDLVGDYDNDVKAIKLWAKDYGMHPIQGRCPAGYEAVNGVGTSLEGGYDSGLELSRYNFSTALTKLPTYDELSKLKPIQVKSTSIIYQFIDNDVPLSQSESSVMVGLLKVASRGYYTFSLSSDNGAKLSFGGTLLLSTDGVLEKTTVTRKIYLGDGYQDIRIEYVQASGGDGVQIKYQGPDTDSQSIDIPAANLFNRKWTTAEGASIDVGLAAFTRCEAESNCCGVSETADEEWRKAHPDKFMLVQCDVKETGSDKDWWTTCVKVSEKNRICDNTAMYSEHPFSWTSFSGVSTKEEGETTISAILQKSSDADTINNIEKMLHAYSQLRSSAASASDQLIGNSNKEIALLAMNMVATKFGEGDAKTSWGEGLLQDYKEKACRQTRLAEDLPPSQLPGDCSSHNLYRDYKAWYETLPSDTQAELLKYGMAAVAQELKFDIEQNGEDVYYPWQDCYTNKTAIESEMAAINVNLMGLFYDRPKDKKYMFNHVLNTKPELCQWRSFIDTYAFPTTVINLINLLGEQPRDFLVALQTEPKSQDQASAMFTDLGVLLKLLVTFTYNEGTYPKVMWPQYDDNGEELSSVLEAVPIVEEKVSYGMSLALMSMSNNLVLSQVSLQEAFAVTPANDARIGSSCASSDDCGRCAVCSSTTGKCHEKCFDTTDGTARQDIRMLEKFWCDYGNEKPQEKCSDASQARVQLEEFKARALAEDSSLSPEEQIQAAMSLRGMEEQAICGEVEPADCIAQTRRDLRTIYETSESRKGYAKQAATFGRLSFDMGYCLDHEGCKVRHGWKRIAGVNMAKLAALFQAYGKECKIAWKTAGISVRTYKVFTALKVDNAKKAAKLTQWVSDQLGDGNAVGQSSLVTRTLKSRGAFRATNGAVKGVADAASKSGGKAAGTLMKSGFMTSLKASGKAAFAVATSVAKHALAALGAFGLVFDVYSLIDYFVNGEIALGVFSIISAIGGVISVIASVCSMAFGTSTLMMSWSGPLAPLVGAIVGAIAAIGALIYSLLNTPPGNQDYGDQFCCYTVVLGMNPKVLGGRDNPTSKFAGKSESDCHEYGTLLQLLPSSEQVGGNASQRIHIMEEIP